MNSSTHTHILPVLEFSRLLVAVISVALCSAIINQYVSQAAIMAVVLLCIPKLTERRYPAPQVPRSWLVALSFISLAAIPMAFLSNSMRPMDAPLRYTVLIIPLLTLHRYELPIRSMLRCMSSASLMAAVIVLGLDLYPETRFKFIEETRYDFGLGLLDSAFAAAFLLPLTAVQLVLDRRQCIWRLLGLASILSAFVIIIMSGTRASWLALAGAPLLSLLLLRCLSRRVTLSVLVMVILAAVLSYSFTPIVKERIDAARQDLKLYFYDKDIDSKNSLGLRFELWKVATETFRRNPVWGTSYDERAAISREMISTGLVSSHVGVNGKGGAHNEVVDG